MGDISVPPAAIWRGVLNSNRGRGRSRRMAHSDKIDTKGSNWNEAPTSCAPKLSVCCVFEVLASVSVFCHRIVIKRNFSILKFALLETSQKDFDDLFLLHFYKFTTLLFSLLPDVLSLRLRTRIEIQSQILKALVVIRLLGVVPSAFLLIWCSSLFVCIWPFYFIFIFGSTGEGGSRFGSN